MVSNLACYGSVVLQQYPKAVYKLRGIKLR